MRALGIDFETQGADPLTTNVTEVGAVMLEVGESQGELPIPLLEFDSFIHEPSYPPQTQEILEITGITDDMLRSEGRPLREVFLELIQHYTGADLIVAHNKKFDQRVFEATCQRLGLEYPEREWLCTYTEVPYPARVRCHQLSHLALDHGIRMDGRVLHRAKEDVRLMLELVFTKYSLSSVLEYKREPWVYLRADILGPWAGRGGDNGVGKGLAQKLGYSWQVCKGTDGPTFEKAWVKRVKQKDVEEQKRVAPFRVVVL